MQGDTKRREVTHDRMTRRAAIRNVGIATAAVGLVPALSACGADEPDEVAVLPDEAPGTPTATVPLTTLVPMRVLGATPEAAQEAAPGATPAGERHLVEMNDELEFVPEHLTLQVGDTVVWRTVGAVPHTSTCDPELAENPDEHVQLPEGAETWHSETVGEGEEYERTFEVPGEYTYFCVPHENNGMIGYLTVEE